jgi:hypothetical protein
MYGTCTAAHRPAVSESHKKPSVEKAAHRWNKSHGDGVGPRAAGDHKSRQRLAAKSTASANLIGPHTHGGKPKLSGAVRQTKFDSDTNSLHATLADFTSPQAKEKKRRRSPASAKATRTAPALPQHDTPFKLPTAKIAKGSNSKDVTSGTKKAEEGPQQLVLQQTHAPLGLVTAAVAAGAAPATASAGADKDQKGHDKYCHFCQHVKINMLACTTFCCTHRYVYFFCTCCVGAVWGQVHPLPAII